MLRDFLNYWLLSVPMSGDLSAEQMLAAARLPLAKLHPTARAFWQAYCTSAKIGALAAGVFWRRSLCFAAARMAQAAYELSSNMHEPPNLAVATLQLASNILADPQDASLRLFGVPMSWSRARHAVLNA